MRTTGKSSESIGCASAHYHWAAEGERRSYILAPFIEWLSMAIIDLPMGLAGPVSMRGGKQRGREAGRWADGQAGRQAGRQAGENEDKPAARQPGRQTGRQMKTIIAKR